MAEGLVAQAAAPDTADAIPTEATGGEDAATPEEQQQYDSAMQMVSEMLHANDDSSAQIVKMLSTDNPIAAITDVVEFLISKVEETFQGNLVETAIMPIADETTDWVIELGEEGGAFDLTDQEIVQAKGSVVQLLLDQYGVEQADMEGMLEGVSEEEVASYAQAFGGQI